MNVDKFAVGKFTVKIEYDDNPMSPREWDNLGTIVAWHRRYKLGDEQPSYPPSEFKPEEHAIALPLYLYDHSGLRLKVGSFDGLLPQGHAEWDSGQVGWIYIDAEKIRKEYGVKRISKKLLATVEGYLRADVKTYDEYLSGQVYGYVVEDENSEIVDSLWEIYGLDYAREKGKASAESWQRKAVKVDKLQLEANV